MADRRHPGRHRSGAPRGLPHRAARQRQRDRMAPDTGARAALCRARPRRGRRADSRPMSSPMSSAMSGWQDVKRLLCVRLDGLGDVLMSTPAMRAFRQSLGCRITLLTSAAGAAAAPFIPEVDDVMTFAAPWMKATASAATRDAEMIATLGARGFDAAAIFNVYSQNPLPAAYMCHLAGIPRRLAHCHENPYQLLTDWVADPEPSALIRHEVRRQLDLAAAIGVSTANERLSFRVPSAAKRRIARLRSAGRGRRPPMPPP